MDNSLIEGFTQNNYYNLDNDNFLLDNNTVTDNNYIINESMNESSCQMNMNNTENNINNSQCQMNNTENNINNSQCQMNKSETNSKGDNKLENNDILKILENDEFYDPSNNIKINNKDIDAIIYNLVFIENEFIQDIKNKNIVKINSYPNIDEIITLYFERYKNILNSFNIHKYFIYFLNIIYFFIIIYIFIGWASPYNLLLYHIIVSILFLILFENKKKSSPFRIILELIYKKDINLLPFNYILLKKIILLLVLISFIGLLNKKYTFFLFLKNIITILSKYN